jgi:CheY-like chemotaxis protein
MNLCSNAAQAMEQGGGTITISLSERTLTAQDLRQHPKVEPGRFVVLGVADTGPGIPATIRDKIFEPYFTTKAAGKGTGMGLAIIDGIVTTSGGLITCTSEPGRGALFEVFFPAIDTAPEATLRPAEEIARGRERILLVDDEAALVTMEQAILEKLGYEVTSCGSGMEALKLFTKEPEHFDLVLTDQTMPGLTGMELARHLLQIRPELPIILCTGFSNLVDEKMAKSCGIKGFAMKPLSLKDLAGLLRQALEG